MRHSILAALVTGVLAMLFTAAVAVVVMNVEARLDLARGSVETVKQHVNLTALHHGTLSWDGLYESNEDALAVWHTSPRLADMELEDGAKSSDQCLKLSRVEQFYAVGRTTTVRLCAVGSGTLMSVNQRLYLRP